jgi:hypothetical protein
VEYVLVVDPLSVGSVGSVESVESVGSVSSGMRVGSTHSVKLVGEVRLRTHRSVIWKVGQGRVERVQVQGGRGGGGGER